jgi:Zn-dependent peptidase ImmA (M78 family)/transcriptional regulator with XRE-family HTH domain
VINGDRLRQAREIRRLTQTELAKRVGVSQAAIALFEGGRAQPSPEILQTLALQTGFLPAFFRQPNEVEFPQGSLLLFRSRASMTATDRAEAHQLASLMFKMAWTMARHMKKRPAMRLPQVMEDVTTAATVTRDALGLAPDRPVVNLIRALEMAGVFVFTLPERLEGRDAFAAWAGAQSHAPVLVVSGNLPGDRLRYSVGHEIAHLVMHQPVKGRLEDLEKEADQFASELLMPEAAMREELSAPVTLTGLAPLKRRWGVSLQALIHRSLDLEIITARQYRYLFEQLTARGWRLREPPALDVPVEKPRALRQLAEMLYGNPIDYAKLASEFGLTTTMVKSIIEAHAAKGELTPPHVDTQPAPDTGKILSFESKF